MLPSGLGLFVRDKSLVSKLFGELTERYRTAAAWIYENIKVGISDLVTTRLFHFGIYS